ncbi:MAG: hypothetical protein ABSE73_03530 [Planctomycetota bacterium]
MSSGSNTVVEKLEYLATLLQELNRAITAVDVKAIAKSADEIGQLLPGLEQSDLSKLAPSQMGRARSAAARIRGLQDVNQSLCNTGLKVVNQAVKTLRQKSGNAYDEDPSEGVPQGLNVSV